MDLAQAYAGLKARSAGSGLSPNVTALINAPENELHISAASIWEIAIKSALGRTEFGLHPGVFRRELFESGYEELAIAGNHAAAVSTLPDLHKDPFDRILVAQAMVEGITLLTADQAVLSYQGPGALRALIKVARSVPSPAATFLLGARSGWRVASANPMRPPGRRSSRGT